MKTSFVLAALILTAGFVRAQDPMAEQLKKAIIEEESGQNLDKAIQAYQGILTRFNEARQTAATALFHLADCYRKQGKRDQAIAAYQRVLKEFSDQAKLAAASRNYLKTYGVSVSGAAPEEIVATRQEADARMRYRALLQQQIALAEREVQGLQKRVETGQIARGGPEMTRAMMQLLDLQRALAAFDAGAAPIIPDYTKK
jgi:tetratricopeptide (TPR) repeat protein